MPAKKTTKAKSAPKAKAAPAKGKAKKQAEAPVQEETEVVEETEADAGIEAEDVTFTFTAKQLLTAFNKASKLAADEMIKELRASKKA